MQDSKLAMAGKAAVPAIFALLASCMLVECAFAVEAQPSLAVDKTDVTIVPLMDSGDSVIFQAQAGRSYCCEIYRAFPTTAIDGVFEARFDSLVSVSPLGIATPLPFTARGQAEPEIPLGVTSGATPPLPENTRLCFTASVSSLHGCGTKFGTNGNAANVPNIAVRVVETTLFGGFNTSITDFNFLEIRNISNVTITGKVDAFDSVTDQEVLSDVSFTVQAGKRVDIDIHSRTGPGKFGPVVLTHDGPYGTIQAQVSQYNIVTVSPLDFVPVAAERLQPR